MKKLIFLLCALCASHLFAQQEGTLDGDFDGDGLAILTGPIFDYGENANAIAVQPDGKIVVAGYILSNLFTPDQILARFNTDGSLDNSFGDEFGNGSGYAIIDHFNQPAILENAEAMVVLSNGNIVTGGIYANTSFALNGFKPNGLLDLDFGNYVEGGSISNFLNPVTLYDLCLQTDEFIVAAGSVFDGISSNFALSRNYPGGFTDNSFSVDGMLSTDFSGGNDAAYSVAVQPNGKIVAAGVSNTMLAMARYHADGTLDASFGQNGKVVTVIGEQGYISDVAISSNGKIFAAGHAVVGGAPQGFVACYLSNGTLDSNFGTGGFVFRPDGNFTSVALQYDGKIVAAGTAVSSSMFVVMRYNTNGTPDDSFGFHGLGDPVFGAQANGVALQADGKIVAGGYILDNSISHVAVARYNASFTSGTINPLAAATENLIYPNPVAAEATYGFDLESAAEVSLSIMDFYGKLLKQPISKSNVSAGKQEVPLSLGDLVPGNYMLVLQAGAHNVTTKFIKN